MYERAQCDPLDREEWERRTRENVESCDSILRSWKRPLTMEERIQTGRMVGRQMRWEKANDDKKSVL